MKKILFLTSRHFRNPGGVERYIQIFLRHYDGKTFQLYFGAPPDALTNAQTNPLVNCLSYSSQPGTFKNFFRFLNPLRALRTLRPGLLALIGTIKPDVIFTRDYDIMAALETSDVSAGTVFLPGSLLKLDMRLDHRPETGSIVYKLSRRLQEYVRIHLENLALNNASQILVFSRAFKSRIMENYRVTDKKISVLPMGVDLPLSQPADRDIDRKMILAVGRLSRSKNFSLLIETMPHLPDFHLHILGDGPEKQNLSALAKTLNVTDRVFLPGHVSDVSSYYKKCRFFIHPSLYENFGQVLLEAMACGKPPIVIDPEERGVLTASKEIIRHGLNGFFVKNTPSALARLIKDLMNSSPDLTQNCFETVKNYFFDSHIKQLLPYLLNENQRHCPGL